MSQSTGAPVWAPTAFPHLNEVLRVLVDRASERLGKKFVGAYLQGSFAVGDADANSDCDFILAISDDLTADEVAGLDELHRSIHELPQLPWRHRLEGSYAPIGILRRWSLSPRDPPGEPARPADWQDAGLSGSGPRVYPFFYLSHGGRSLTRSEHDNTEVVRWSLREKGIVLVGPEPRDLIDPVTPAALRAEMRRTMDLCLAVDLRPLDRVRDQAFWVGLFCRMLHTNIHGGVASKRAALAWSATTMDSRWRELVERIQAIRPGAGAHDMPIDHVEIVATRGFALFVSELLNHPSHEDGPIPSSKRRTEPRNASLGEHRLAGNHTDLY